MKILSIDTSSNICSVSILENKNVIYNKSLKNTLTHSEKLMPMIEEAFNNIPFNISDIDLFTCSKGPGSFTGIRIGVATIHAFCDYYNKPGIGISSLEALAYNLEPEDLLCSMIDAKNDNVYAGLFKYLKDHYELVNSYMSGNINSIFESLKNYENEKIHFIGTGAIAHNNLIKETFTNSVLYEDEKNDSSSISIANAALYKFENNIDDISLSPLYLKKSSAEIELEKKKKDN